MKQEVAQHYLNSKPPRRRGVALMLVMIAILVTGSMALAYYGSRDNSIDISVNVEASTKARTIAESGIDLAVVIFETNADWRTNHVEGVIVSDLAIGDGTVTITVLDTETGLPPTETSNEVEITVVSSVAGLTQTTQAIATIIPADDEFDVDFSEFAIFTVSQLSIHDVASVDQWSASPLASKQREIQVGTLSTRPMSVRIDSWNQSKQLQLHRVRNASSMISATPMESKEFPDIPNFLQPPNAPSGGEALNISSEGSFKDSLKSWAQTFTTGHSYQKQNVAKNTTHVYGGEYEVQELTLSSNQSLAIHGDVIIKVEEDFNLTNASIILDDDATLTLHIGEDLYIRSSYIGNQNQSVGSWMDPNRIQLYGHGDGDWSLGGNTTLKGEIYAPQSEFEAYGSTTICGRIAADVVSLNGASRLLYDQSLDNGGYADFSSDLYDDDGFLHSELRQLAILDPVLIQSIQQSISELEDEDNYRTWQDWQIVPTERPNEVIFMLVVYGVDSRVWEDLARLPRQQHYTAIDSTEPW